MVLSFLTAANFADGEFSVPACPAAARPSGPAPNDEEDDDAAPHMAQSAAVCVVWQLECGDTSRAQLCRAAA